MRHVKATDASATLNVRIQELGRIAFQGEEFDVSESRFKTLAGNNMYHAVFVVLAEQKVEEEVKPMRSGHALSHRWKAWLAVAAAFIFLFGGTLLTRKSFHNETSWNPGNGQPDVVFRPAAFNPPDGNPKTETTDPQEQNEAALFFEDMWMFLKISLPWAGGAGVVVLLVFLIRKRKKEHRS